MIRPGSMPQDAATIAFGWASVIRVASSFGAFLKGVVRERERADDELRRAADKQLARIEFGE